MLEEIEPCLHRPFLLGTVGIHSMASQPPIKEHINVSRYFKSSVYKMYVFNHVS